MINTKIVATIGPASCTYDDLLKLIKAGVSVMRLNFSHGDHKWHQMVIGHIKRIKQKFGVSVAILLDTKGPEIRTADLKQPIALKADDIVIFTSQETDLDNNKIAISYDAFVDDVEVGKDILIDNGLMRFVVEKKTKHEVQCRVLEGGTMGSRRHVNLPGKEVSLQAITEQDWRDIAFGVEQGVDFIALSFVRQASEIYALREFLHNNKADNIHIIAKIESYESTKHLGTIMQAADGAMVARGDLGAELPFVQVPFWQKQILQMGANMQKPIIVATHMLESMIHYPLPTRAEVTDVATAMWQQADAVMLSGETASGKYPLKAVNTLVDIAKENENPQPLRQLEIVNEVSALAHLAAKLPTSMPQVAFILIITRSGSTARLVSSFRPQAPIFAFTNEPQSRRQMHLLWGVRAARIDFSANPQMTIKRAESNLCEDYPDLIGKKYVLVSAMLVEEDFVSMLQIRTLKVHAK